MAPKNVYILYSLFYMSKCVYIFWATLYNEAVHRLFIDLKEIL
jgi:hypothetical protein